MSPPTDHDDDLEVLDADADDTAQHRAAASAPVPAQVPPVAPPARRSVPPPPRTSVRPPPPTRPAQAQPSPPAPSARRPAPTASPARAPAHVAPAVVKPESIADESPWYGAVERTLREAEACVNGQPARAALLFATHARIAHDLRGDTAASDAAIQRAYALAPDARIVAASRRWAAERKNKPGDVALLARAEAALTGDPAERIALLLQIAAFEQSGTGRAEALEKTLREVATLDPSEPAAWEGLATLDLRRKNHREAVTVLETLASLVQDGPMRASLFTTAATLREIHMDDAAGAIALLQKAVEADPTCAPALAALEPLLLRARAWLDYARVLVQQGDQIGDANGARELYERAGDVLWECANDAPSAVACYERAAAMAPRESGPIEKLAAVLESVGRHADLARAYERWLQLSLDPVTRAALLHQVGSLYELHLAQPDDAIRSYRLALEAVPGFAPATHALSMLYRSRTQWRDWVALEALEAERLAQPTQRAMRYVALGEVHEAVLDDVPGALGWYQRALSTDGANVAAYDGVDRLLRGLLDWDGVVAVLEKLLATTRDPRRVRALRVELATLLHDRVGEPGRAVPVLRSALETAPDELYVLHRLARALADEAKWTELVEVLEAQLALLRDEADIAGTLDRIGSVLEHRVGDGRRALAVYTRLLEKAPQHEGALRAVLRLHESQSRWDDVIATERKLLTLAASPEAAAFALYRIARIAEQRIGRPDDAIKAYEEALARWPGFALGRLSLERLLRVAGKHARIADLAEKAAEATQDVTSRVRHLCEAARAYELHLNDPVRAMAAYDKAVVAAPDRDAPAWALLRLREVKGDWARCEPLLQALLGRAGVPPTQLRVLVRLARLYEFRLPGASRASAPLEQALEAVSDATGLVLDRVRIARVDDHRDDTRSWLARAAESTVDPRFALALRRQAALLAEASGAPPADVLSAFTHALLLSADDVASLDGLGRALEHTPGDGRLPATLRARAHRAHDPAHRALLSLAAGLRAENAASHAEAEVCFREALEAVPDYLSAYAGLRRLRERAGDYQAAATLAARAGEISVQPANAIDARIDAGDTYADKLARPDLALEQFRTVVTRQPSHEKAFSRALRLYDSAGDFRGAADLLSVHAEAIADAAQRARLQAMRSTILADRLGDVPAAIDEVRKALLRRPDDAPLLALLGRFHEREQHWQDAVQTYERLARVANDGPMHREALVAQARVWTVNVKDYAKARAVLEQLHKIDASDRPVAVELAKVCARVGDTSRARDLYRELGSRGVPVERAESLVALSELLRSVFDDRGGAHKSIAEAFSLAAADPTVVPALEEHAQRTDDWAAFTAAGEQALSASTAAQPGVLALRLSLARAYRDKLRSSELADRHLRAAIEADPKAVEPRVALASGLLGGNDQGAAAEFRRVVEIEPTACAAYRGLMTVCQRNGMTGATALMASSSLLLGEGGNAAEGALSLAVSPPALPNSLLPDDVLQLLVGASRARLARRVMAAIDPFAHEIAPEATDLAASLVRVPDSHPVAQRARAIGAALGLPSVAIYRGPAREPRPVLVDPRGLVLPSELLGDSVSPGTVYALASGCARMAAGSAFGAARAMDIVRATAEVATDEKADGPGYRELRKRVASALPRKARKEIEKAFEETPGDLKRELTLWEDEERTRARRVGVLFSRDLRAVGAAVAPDVVSAPVSAERNRAIGANAALGDALRFAVSEACWSAHRRVFGQA